MSQQEKRKAKPLLICWTSIYNKKNESFLACFTCILNSRAG